MMKWILNVPTLRMPGMILSFSVRLSWVRDSSVVCGMIIACSCASSECNHYLWKSATDALPDKSWQGFSNFSDVLSLSAGLHRPENAALCEDIIFFSPLSFVFLERRWNETRQINNMIWNGGKRIQKGRSRNHFKIQWTTRGNVIILLISLQPQ